MAQPPPQPPRYLFTKENAPATYSTKWEDLHPETQNVMLEIEKRILEYRDESQRIDQCRRLRDSSVHDNRFELDASNILQELYGITMGMDRQKVTLKERVAVVKDMLQNTDKAVRSFMRLQLKYLQANFYRGTPEKPSPFLQHTVARFEKLLSECRRSIEELEQLLHSDSGKHSSDSRSSQMESLAEVLENVHGFFIHVAAKVESIHERIESMRTAYIADLRRQGFKKNPFLDTDRTETARKEAAAQQIGGDTGQLALPAAQMIHPTMHFSPVPQPTGQATGHLALPAGTDFSSWYASPSAFGFSTTPAASSTPAFGFSTAPAASSTPAFGFSTAPAASSTPAFGFSTAPAASSTPAFGSTTTPAVSSTPAFGSTTAPAASSKPAFGFSTPPAASSTPAFGSIIAPAASSTSSLHSTTTGPAPFPSSPFGSFSASSPASGVSAPAASSIPSMLSTTIISPPRQLSRFTVWEEMLSSASGNSDTAAAAAALSSPSSFSTPTGSAAFPSSRFTASASASSHDTSTPASASSSPSPLSPLSSSRSRSLPASGASTISHFSTEAATGSQPSSGTPPRVNKRDGTHLKSPSPKHRLPR